LLGKTHCEKESNEKSLAEVVSKIMLMDILERNEERKRMIKSA